MNDLKNIIESLLFVSEAPLTIDRIKDVLETVEANEIREAVATLTKEYQERQGGIILKEVAGGIQIRTRPEYHEWIKRLLKPNPHRLSKAALETLAIIAYKQPIIRSDIEHLRGVDSGGVLRMLMEKKLVRVLGRKEIPGRPLIYATTKRFLEVFELKDLRDLPSPREIEVLSDLPSHLEKADGYQEALASDPPDLDSPDNEPEQDPKQKGDVETDPEPDPEPESKKTS